jgi:alcohol dehydrogenase
MDSAKALGALVVGGGERIAPYFIGGSAPVRGIPPLICMPTTAGTGSEVTYVAVVTAGAQKMVVRDPLLAPTLALIDPALTLSMPPRLTAATGMDALSHALEALTSSLASPLCDVLALDAIQRIALALPRAVDSGDDLQARSEMSLAALGAGMSFLNARVHLGHAVGHSLGTAFKLPHGLACIVCMPALLEFLRPTCGLQLAQIADALGVVGIGDEEAAEHAAPALAALMRRCGAPGLGELADVDADDIPRLVELVLAEGRLIDLSRAQPSREEWAAIFEASL